MQEINQADVEKDRAEQYRLIVQACVAQIPAERENHGANRHGNKFQGGMPGQVVVRGADQAQRRQQAAGEQQQEEPGRPEQRAPGLRSRIR